MIFFTSKVSRFTVYYSTLIRKLYTFASRWRWKSYYYSIVPKFGYFGENITLCHGIKFGAAESIFIGDNVFIGDDVILNAAKGGRIDIGKQVSIGSNSTFITWNYDNFNNRYIDRNQSKKNTIVQSIKIGDGVDIGYNSTINSGSNLGDGCIVASGSVVSGTFEPFSIIAGSPAIILGTRRSNGLVAPP